MKAFVHLLIVPALAFTAEYALGQGSEPALSTSLRFLLGEWEAIPQPGQGSGYFSFSSELGGRVVVRKNHAEYPASEGRPAGIHDDLMMIYVEGAPAVCRALYVDTEGHVIRYTGKIGADSQVTFVSEGAAGEPRYRLSYAKLPDGTLGGKFEGSAPGKPDAFTTFFEWTAKPRGAPGER
jgi:hypothetical protein